MSRTIRDEFRKELSSLDDKFIDTMTVIGDRVRNIMTMVENDEDKSCVLSYLQDLLDEVE